MDLETGRQAARILDTDEYASKSSIGRLLGVSHTYVGKLIDAARAAPEPDSPTGIPVLDNTVAANYVLSMGASIRRSISAFSAPDVLYASGLDPRLFDSGDGYADVPNMLWHLDNGDWVGVSKATVGYGGTGCGYSRDALTRAGLDPAIAHEIVAWRFCDTGDHITGPTSKWTTSTRWPVHARSVPHLLDDRMILMFGDGLTPFRDTTPDLPLQLPTVDESGVLPSATEVSPLQAWLDFLDSDDLPEWARGPRVARAFSTADVAAEQGFIAVPRWTRLGAMQRAHPCIVIEQGCIQMWGFYFRPTDARQYLPDEAYEFLARASVYPHSLREHDKASQSLWARFTRMFVSNNTTPASVDISRSGQGTLAYTPSEPLHFSP